MTRPAGPSSKEDGGAPFAAVRARGLAFIAANDEDALEAKLIEAAMRATVSKTIARRASEQDAIREHHRDEVKSGFDSCTEVGEVV